MPGKLVFLVTEVTCNSISKRQDQTLNVKVNYTYQGPAKTARMDAVVTTETLSQYDEVGSTKKEVSVNLPASPTPIAYATDILGLPLAGCEAKAGYGIKVYALDLDGQPEWGHRSVLTVTSILPTLSVSSLALS